jgi:hypothetical protein
MSTAVETRPSSGQSGLSYGQIVGEIKERNYALIPGPVPPRQLRQVFDSYADFLSLDEDTKTMFSGELVLPGIAKPIELGYYAPVAGQKQKISGQVSRDTKELFHVTRKSLEDFVPKTEGLDPRAVNFIDQVGALYFACERRVEDILEALEQGARGITGQFIREGSDPNFILRLLAYGDMEAKPGQIIGSHHYDQSAGSLELGQTQGDFEIGSSREDEDLEIVSCPPGWSEFFPGKMMEYLDCENLVRRDFPASWHGVRRAHARPYSDKIIRIAGVLFINGLNTPLASTESTRIR